MVPVKLGTDLAVAYRRGPPEYSPNVRLFAVIPSLGSFKKESVPRRRKRGVCVGFL
jgi:hypothetical protein